MIAFLNHSKREEVGVWVIFSEGRGTQQIYIRAGSTRMSNPLLFLDTIFHQKGTPFIYLLLTNGTPFTYLI